MKSLKWLNTIALAAVILINALANLLPIGGNTTGQVSAAFPNLFTPAPITFAIWGIIYLAMVAFVLYQWGALDQGTFSTELRESIGLWFVISCAFNIAWIFCWHNKAIGASVVCIVGLLISLIMIQSRIGASNGDNLRWITVNAGFDIYYGWIIAATIANVSVLLTKQNWDGFGRSDQFWTVAVLLIGAAIGCAVVIKQRKWLSAVAVIWAYAGILIRHLSSSGYGGAYPFVIAAALIGICAMLCTIIVVPNWEKKGQRLHFDAV